MENKGSSYRVSGKQNFLTKRMDLSCRLLKRESDQKVTIPGNTENDTRVIWNEARA